MPRGASSIRSCSATRCCRPPTTTCGSSIRSAAAAARSRRIPFIASASEDIVNPFESAPSASAERLRQYGVALAAYRRALSRHAEDVSLRFERGVASALAANSSSALKQWNTVPLEDPEVAAARQSVERIRTQLFSRR